MHKLTLLLFFIDYLEYLSLLILITLFFFLKKKIILWILHTILYFHKELSSNSKQTC